MNLHIHGHVLPGDKEQDIYVVHGHITFQKVKDAKTVVKDGYILPGLVDCHAHLSLASPTGDEASSEERVRASVKEHLHAGYSLFVSRGVLIMLPKRYVRMRDCLESRLEEDF